MDPRRKTIQELQKRVADISDSLSALYKELGRKLLADDSSYSDAAQIDRFKNLLERRENSSAAINEIKRGIERLQEISRFSKELAKHIDELKNELSNLEEKLGREIFENYDSAYADYFETAYQIAQDEGAILAEKEERLEALKRQSAESGYLKKLLLQAQRLPLEASISQHKSKTAKAFREGGASVFESGVLDRLYEDGKLPEPFAEALRLCRRQNDAIAGQLKRGEELSAEAAKIRSAFSFAGAEENPQRRIDELKNEIKDTDAQLDALLTEVGLGFVNTRVTESGDLIKDGEPIDGKYSSWIDQSLSMRKSRVDMNRRVSILELAIRMDLLQQNIDEYKKNIEDCQTKIAAYHEQISLLEKKLSESEDEKLILENQREELLSAERRAIPQTDEESRAE